MNTFQTMLTATCYNMFPFTLADDGYKNFDVSVYARVFEVIKMKDPVWLKATFEQMDQHLNIDKYTLKPQGYDSY